MQLKNQKIPTQLEDFGTRAQAKFLFPDRVKVFPLSGCEILLHDEGGDQTKGMVATLILSVSLPCLTAVQRPPLLRWVL